MNGAIGGYSVEYLLESQEELLPARPTLQVGQTRGTESASSPAIIGSGGGGGSNRQALGQQSAPNTSRPHCHVERTGTQRACRRSEMAEGIDSEGAGPSRHRLFPAPASTYGTSMCQALY